MRHVTDLPNPAPVASPLCPIGPRPTLAGLIWLLRHREAWPAGFVWDYRWPHGCAMGLALETWPGFFEDEGPLSAVVGRGLGLSKRQARRAFLQGGRSWPVDTLMALKGSARWAETSPEQVAAYLETLR
jgi:hypothetical protein